VEIVALFVEKFAFFVVVVAAVVVADDVLEMKYLEIVEKFVDHSYLNID